MSEIPTGWPCADLPTNPPSVADRLSDPTADDILPQLLQLTPRGAAWGTDEAGSGKGAEPIMLRIWRAIAGHAAQNYKTDFDLATQCLPSAVSFSLPDWETEYGLPDDCFSGVGGTAQRIAAVRARFNAFGGQSPAYFVCLAASIGYEITIEEPSQFMCDTSECIDPEIQETWFRVDEGRCDDTLIEGYVLPAFTLDGDQVSDETMWKHWIVHVQALGETWFRTDEGECDFDPIEGFLQATDLECLLRRVAPPHTVLSFNYDDLAAGTPSTFSMSSFSYEIGVIDGFSGIPPTNIASLTSNVADRGTIGRRNLGSILTSAIFGS